MHITKPQIIFVTISTLIALFFLTLPEIDIKVAGLFYNTEERFFLSEHPIALFLHKSVRYITISVATIWLGLLAYSYIKQQHFWGLTKRKLLYLILALAIGPGLVVNTIFKDNWGRARPHHTEIFGGNKSFTPPFIMTDQCERNCSFVSGDPSVGFYFFALAFAFPTKRRQFFTIALTLGIIFGSTRIVQGAHFFSDVIFSGIFTFSVCYILAKFMLAKKDIDNPKTAH